MIKNYMADFTDEKPKEFSNRKISYKFSFIDTENKCYENMNFTLAAAVKGSWNIEIIFNEDCMKGDGLSLYLLNGSLAHEFQMQDENASNYFNVECQKKVEVILAGLSFYGICQLYFKQNIKKGDCIKIAIKNANSYWTAGKSYFFIEYYDAKVEKALPISNTPFIFEIINREKTALLRVLGPTVTAIRSTEKIHVTAFDLCGNVMEDLQDEVVLEENTYKLTNGLVIIDYSFNEEKVYRLKASLKGDDSLFYSNPIVCKKNIDNGVFWGDLHAHGFGDESMHLMHVNSNKISPFMRHYQGRNIGRFDFCAVGPMSFPKVHREAIWNEYKTVCKQYDEDGIYVPFLSYEAHPPTGGDRNIFFKDLEEILPPNYRIPMYEVDDLYNKRDDVFVECHIGGKIPRFEDNLNNRERMVEVISAFGNAEWLLHHTIKNGYKPAVCACSDLHYGLMGGPKAIEESRGRFYKYLNKRDSAYGTGAITAVIADKVSRNSIWEAMEKRHTYATNDDRTYIDFTVNGKMMGDDIKKSKHYKCHLTLHATAVISEISIISGDYIIKQFTPNDLDFSEDFLIDEVVGDYMYVRVKQVNGGFLITSPVYIAQPYTKWNESIDIKAGSRKKEAEEHLYDVINYIKKEENIDDFSEIQAVDIIDETITSCALFIGYFGKKKISIRWYYEYEVPRIRFDWGYSNNGNKNCEIIHNIKNPD